MNNTQLTYTITEACNSLHISKPIFHKLVSEGSIQTYTIGRRRYVSRDALEEFIRTREAK